MKERIKRYLERNKWIYLWAGISILFAIIVQWLFSKPASSEIFHAKWGAGDILTYASTVALGLLAVWQNQKFKEENDKAQERLEELTKQANDLSIIGRMIDNKSKKLDNLRHAFSDFEAACNVGTITSLCISSTKIASAHSKLSEHAQKLPRLCNILETEIAGNWGVEFTDISSQIFKLNSLTLEIVDQCSGIVSAKGNKETYDDGKITALLKEYAEAYDEFSEARDSYIMETEFLLNAISYKNITLEEIREYIKEP